MNQQADLEKAMDWATKTGLQEHDLDDLVYDLALELRTDEINATADLSTHEALILEASTQGDDINNGGLESQLIFLLTQCTIEELPNLIGFYNHSGPTKID